MFLLREGLHGTCGSEENGLFPIRVKGNSGFERIPGKRRTFQKIAQYNTGKVPPRALSPKCLFPVFPFGEYMYA